MPDDPLIAEYETVVRPKPWSAAAVGAAIFGIPSPLFPVLVLAAIPCAIVGLRTTRGEGYRGRGLAKAGLTMSVVACLWVAATFPLLLGEYRWSKRYRCSEDMRAIAEACFQYARSHGNRMPADLDTVLRSGVVSNRYDEGHRNSYVYLGKDLDLSLSPGRLAETVVMYEPMENHGPDGTYVVFGDGHADFYMARGVGPMLDGLKAGRNPPWPATTQP